MKSNSIHSPKMILNRGGTISTSTGGGGTSFTSKIEIFYVDISFSGVITLMNVPLSKSENVVFNGIILSPGINEDYTLIGNVITFLRTDFQVNDKITVFYNY